MHAQQYGSRNIDSSLEEKLACQPTRKHKDNDEQLIGEVDACLRPNYCPLKVGNDNSHHPIGGGEITTKEGESKTEDMPSKKDTAIAEDTCSVNNRYTAENEYAAKDEPIAKEEYIAENKSITGNKLIAKARLAKDHIQVADETSVVKSRVLSDEELRPEDAIDGMESPSAAGTCNCFQNEKSLPVTDTKEQLSGGFEVQKKQQDKDEVALCSQENRGGHETERGIDSIEASDLGQPDWFDRLPGILHVQDPANLIGQTVWQNADVPPNSGPLVTFFRRSPHVNNKHTMLVIEGCLGSGNHGAVLRGVLTTSENPQDDTYARLLSVAVKVSTHLPKDREHLRKEMMAYTMMASPTKLECSPKAWLEGITFGREPGSSGSSKIRIEHSEGLPDPVKLLKTSVPRFVGYFEPVEENKRTMNNCELLLMEDCGMSVHDFKETEEYQEMEWATKVNIERALAIQAPRMLVSIFATGFLQQSVKWSAKY